MRKVSRENVLDHQTYTDQRDEFRHNIFAVKRPRRVHVGEHLTFLFENELTMRYQVQEMMRMENIVREADIQFEIDTFNEVLGDDGEFGVSLFIEIDSEEVRDVKLREWLGLPKHIYVVLDDGSKVFCKFDPRQVGDDRLSSVQYIKFDTKGQVPVAIGSDLPTLMIEQALSEVQREALSADLAA